LEILATVSHCLRCAVLFLAIAVAMCSHAGAYDGMWNETDMSVNVVLLGSVSVLVKHVMVESSILQWRPTARVSWLMPEKTIPQICLFSCMAGT